MPIATSLAILGGAALSAGASALASSKNSKAINQATTAQTESNASSLALQRDIYSQNKGTLDPFVQRGNVAGNQINALLGLGGNVTSPAAPPPTTYAFGGNNIAEGFDFNRPEQFSAFGMQPAQQTLSGQPQGQTPQQAALDAYNVFKQSTGYTERVAEGNRSLNAGYAGNGLFQSGARDKAAIKYGQTQASGEFGNYVGYLSNQQGVGLSGASALAGVGQGYANNVTNMNSANAQFAGQAAVARANNSNSAIGGIASAFGNAAGALSSYGGGFSAPQATGTYYDPKRQF